VTAPTFAVETRELSKQYGGHVAVDRIDLQVEHGSVFGLVGPNGSGKTTTLSMLAGLRRPTAGAIDLHVERSAIALLPDTPEFEPWLTGREVVDLARALVAPDLRASAVDEALAEAGLADAAERRTGGFSRGMLQRLGVASTLVSNPELLLLDEPCSALDPVGRREVLDLVARQRGRRTAIFSSHILADVQEICDTIGVMREGRLIYQGPLADLLTGAATPAMLVRIRGDATPVIEQLERRPWIRAATELADGELRIEVESLEAAEQHLVGALAEAGAAVVSLRPAAASLERAFLELTR
jgi:ABC-2 type transport system ATP-binding protein